MKLIVDTTACIKKRVYNNIYLSYFMSWIIERLYKSFSFKNSSVQIFVKLN